MGTLCNGRVVIITGAGRGLGREYALAFAAEGAQVVVNDLGSALAGGCGGDHSAADAVVSEIRALGGTVVANYDDVADWDGAHRLVHAALDTFGTLHVIVNNAGILRLSPFEEATLEEWDRTINVHLRGHFCVARHAVDYWRSEHAASRSVSARIINITSGAGLHGAAKQAAYAAAKGGIASLTITQAAELARYGITANAVAPTARTRMTTEFWGSVVAAPPEGFDGMHPANVAPTLVWLGSEFSSHVSGCVFEVGGGLIALANGWQHGPKLQQDRRWLPTEVGPAIDTLLSLREPPRPVWNN